MNIETFYVGFVYPLHVPCCKYIGCLVVNIEIKVSDDSFQAEHQMTDIVYQSKALINNRNIFIL